MENSIKLIKNLAITLSIILIIGEMCILVDKYINSILSSIMAWTSGIMIAANMLVNFIRKCDKGNDAFWDD